MSLLCPKDLQDYASIQVVLYLKPFIINNASETIMNWIESLKQQKVKYVRFEIPDLHGISRLKVIPISKVEGYTLKGLNCYSGIIALDTASNVVPGSGYHEEHVVIPINFRMLL